MVHDGKDGFIVSGFQFSGISAGVKKQDGAKDLGLIHSAIPGAAAGVFTTNQIKAAPVLLDLERIGQGRGQTILVNSGNANACTGERGRENACLLADLAADELSVDRELILVASTGVIGEQLPMDRIVKKIPKLVQELSSDGVERLAEAIMTTDTQPKIAYEMLTLGGKDVRICGVAKGSGMIHPKMATMLSFIVSDVSIEAKILQGLTNEGVDKTYNRITIDGDTSTNDTLLVLANGRAGNVSIDRPSPDLIPFQEKLWTVMDRLSRALIMDAEGATKFVEIRVQGAPREEAALEVAFCIAKSPLVKTAFFGEDINWGRILCAAGYAPVAIEPGKIDLSVDTVSVVQNGLGCGKEAEHRAVEAMKRRSFTVTLDLHLGAADASVFTSDLSCGYVTINGSYRT